MIQYTKTYTRPNTSVAWWFHVELSVKMTDFQAIMKTRYRDTEKCLFDQMVPSLDGLSLTYQAYWASEEALAEFLADLDLSLFWNARNEYNSLNGIVNGPATSTPL
jgi:hypothetical protein